MEKINIENEFEKIGLVNQLENSFLKTLKDNLLEEDCVVKWSDINVIRTIIGELFTMHTISLENILQRMIYIANEQKDEPMAKKIMEYKHILVECHKKIII